MANRIRTGDPRGFNKGRSLKFRVGSRVRQTAEEGQRTYQLRRRGNNNKDEDNSPKTLKDKNHQASSQKFRRLISNSLLFVRFIHERGNIKQILLHTCTLYLSLNPGTSLLNPLRRFEDLEMRSNRKILNILYRDHITNEEVRKRITTAFESHDSLFTKWQM